MKIFNNKAIFILLLLELIEYLIDKIDFKELPIWLREVADSFEEVLLKDKD